MTEKKKIQLVQTPRGSPPNLLFFKSGMGLITNLSGPGGIAAIFCVFSTKNFPHALVFLRNLEVFYLFLFFMTSCKRYNSIQICGQAENNVLPHTKKEIPLSLK